MICWILLRSISLLFRRASQSTGDLWKRQTLLQPVQPADLFPPWFHPMHPQRFRPREKGWTSALTTADLNFKAFTNTSLYLTADVMIFPLWSWSLLGGDTTRTFSAAQSWCWISALICCLNHWSCTKPAGSCCSLSIAAAAWVAPASNVSKWAGKT